MGMGVVLYMGNWENTTKEIYFIHMFFHECFVFHHMPSCILIYMLILMLWHSQVIFESKGDELSSSAECRIRISCILIHMYVYNICPRCHWTIERINSVSLLHCQMLSGYHKIRVVITDIWKGYCISPHPFLQNHNLVHTSNLLGFIGWIEFEVE